MRISPSQWRHAKAEAYLATATALFGPPTFYEPSAKGFAIWRRGNADLFVEHQLHDEAIAHDVPRRHKDFFISSVRFYVPPDKLLSIKKISGSIWYDGLKKLLSARCSNLNANIATLYLGMMIAMGKLSIREVHRKNLYPVYIRGEAMTHDEMRQRMQALKRENRRRYRKPLHQAYYELAFPKGATSWTRNDKHGHV